MWIVLLPFLYKTSVKSTYLSDNVKLKFEMFSRNSFRMRAKSLFSPKIWQNYEFPFHHFYQIWILHSKYNFGKDQEITIEIRRMTRRGWYDWDIGNGKFFSLSKDYFFNFRIKTHSDNFTLLNCTALVPCSIIVRQRSDWRSINKISWKKILLCFPGSFHPWWVIGWVLKQTEENWLEFFVNHTRYSKTAFQK